MDPEIARQAREEEAAQTRMSMEDQIEDFLKSNERNRWLFTDDMKIYLRNRSYRMGITILDIGSVEVFRPGCGLFKKLLPVLLEKACKAGVDGVYIENVLTPRFADFFRRQGWIERGNYHDLSPSLYIKFDRDEV